MQLDDRKKFFSHASILARSQARCQDTSKNLVGVNESNIAGPEGHQGYSLIHLHSGLIPHADEILVDGVGFEPTNLARRSGFTDRCF